MNRVTCCDFIDFVKAMANTECIAAQIAQEVGLTPPAAL